jgi:TRAP-type C4-dicarboxylate transport system substrate-binding protein
MRPRSTTLVLLTSMACLLAACGLGGSDKAGGSTAPVTLRIAVHEEHDFLGKLFTDEVRRLSHGRIRFEFLPGTADNDPADAPVRFANKVRDGRYDLAVIEAPAWDELGVRSLEPLQAPFLITDQSLFKAVLASPLAAKMLAGLRSQHVVGLSLMMTWLQHPVSDAGPLSTPSDFQGKRILAPVSRLNDAVISALGATPVHLNFAQAQKSIARHEIDGQEMPAFARPNVWLTGNVTFSATALTVVANEQRFAKLSDQQRRILREAASHAAQSAAAVMAEDPEVGLVERHCQRGHVVLAGRAELAAFEQAVGPVYVQLERDPQVKATIAAIRELKRRTPPDRAPKIPASCSPTVATTHARVRDPSFLDGTYRWRITRAGALKVGADPNDPVIETIATMTLRGGRFALDVGGGCCDTGTFKVIGNRIAFDTPYGYTNTFTLRRRADGTLDLKPVLPMDVGDRVVTSSSPWTRVGPPVREIP